MAMFPPSIYNIVFHSEIDMTNVTFVFRWPPPTSIHDPVLLRKINFTQDTKIGKYENHFCNQRPLASESKIIGDKNKNGDANNKESIGNVNV